MTSSGGETYCEACSVLLGHCLYCGEPIKSGNEHVVEIETFVTAEVAMLEERLSRCSELTKISTEMKSDYQSYMENKIVTLTVMLSDTRQYYADKSVEEVLSLITQ